METKDILNRIENGFCEVLGAGISNRPLVKWLLDKNAKVRVRDIKPESKIKGAQELIDAGAELISGENYLSSLCNLENPEMTIIFRSPGLRPDAKEILQAQKDGALLTSEMELFFMLTKATKIGITGSDGKTTTTTLIGKILEKGIYSGKVYVGGNIGKPLLPEVYNMTENDFAVVELSSFQLQTMKVPADIAVITNITPNHLNWHRDMQEYTEAKYNIFKNGNCKKLILCSDNDLSFAAAEISKKEKIKPDITFFSLCTHSHNDAVKGFENKASAIYEKDGYITESYGDAEEKILKISDIKVRGRHNILNYMAAYAATKDFAGTSTLQDVAENFGGVAHRIEFVRELSGVEYYNSSIDSTPTRTNAALSSFDEKVIAICGGYDKNIPFAPLAETLAKHAKAVVITGGCIDKIKDAIDNCEECKNSGLEIFVCKEFANAVDKAHDIAEKGDTVILSPACASFDAFDNFEQRGNKFKEIVNSYEK